MPLGFARPFFVSDPHHDGTYRIRCGPNLFLDYNWNAYPPANYNVSTPDHLDYAPLIYSPGGYIPGPNGPIQWPCVLFMAFQFDRSYACDCCSDCSPRTIFQYPCCCPPAQSQNCAYFCDDLPGQQVQPCGPQNMNCEKAGWSDRYFCQDCSVCGQAPYEGGWRRDIASGLTLSIFFGFNADVGDGTLPQADTCVISALPGYHVDCDGSSEGILNRNRITGTFDGFVREVPALSQQHNRFGEDVIGTDRNFHSTAFCENGCADGESSHTDPTACSFFAQLVDA